MNRYKLKKSSSLISNFEDVFDIRILTILKYLGILFLVLGFLVSFFGLLIGNELLSNIFGLYLFLMCSTCAFHLVKFIAKLLYFLLIKYRLFNNLCYIPLSHEDVVKMECDKDVLDYILLVRKLLVYEPHTLIDKFLLSDIMQAGCLIKAPITENHVNSMIKFIESEYDNDYYYNGTRYFLNYNCLKDFPFEYEYTNKQILLDYLRVRNLYNRYGYYML